MECWYLLRRFFLIKMISYKRALQDFFFFSFLSCQCSSGFLFLAIIFFLLLQFKFYSFLFFFFRIMKTFNCIPRFKRQALKVKSKILTCHCYGELLGRIFKPSAFTQRHMHKLYSGPPAVQRKIPDTLSQRFRQRGWEKGCGIYKNRREE